MYTADSPPPLHVVVATRRFALHQLLVKDFIIDSITVKPLQTTFASGVDYMADYDEWLFIQVSENSDYTDRR